MIPKHFILWNIIRNNIFESLELKDFSKLNPLVEKIVYESERYFTDNSPDVNDQVNKLVEALKEIANNPCLDPEGNVEIAKQALSEYREAKGEL